MIMYILKTESTEHPSAEIPNVRKLSRKMNSQNDPHMASSVDLLLGRSVCDCDGWVI